MSRALPMLKNYSTSMRRTSLVLVACAALAIGGLTLAQHGEHGKGDSRVKVLSRKDIAEKLDGKKARATTVEVTLRPGQVSAPHRHPGPVFGYVIEGEYEWAIDDKPARTLKAGDTFYEPTGCLHRVSKNPSKKGNTRVLAVVLHPHDAKEIVIPQKKEKK
jgi:quercetin dioxygenase-like cupin family protein